MLPRRHHTPPVPASNRLQCPVCRKSVYSKAGIHPQCAIKLVDQPLPDAEPTAIADSVDASRRA
ncbi:hypothetical protein [Paludisphaera rhizosphaerae]|uniref:hypothetical protein n=1 Tax=Paludisphaera rhizosphaerae TaxID=2711216 RepID=UPI0013EB6F42|nr:hypothetical protein [Paludisphaera rhizosphaerae]